MHFLGVIFLTTVPSGDQMFSGLFMIPEKLQDSGPKQSKLILFGDTLPLKAELVHQSIALIEWLPCGYYVVTMWYSTVALDL